MVKLNLCKSFRTGVLLRGKQEDKSIFGNYAILVFIHGSKTETSNGSGVFYDDYISETPGKMIKNMQ